MSFAGFKKQINKANQFLNETIGGAKGTDYDEDFQEMERRIDTTTRLLDDLLLHTHEFLQPNPATRAKLMAASQLSKLRGTGPGHTRSYPQPEGTLGNAMVERSKELGPCPYSESLQDCGETFRQLAEYKYNLEESVKQSFLEPIHHTKKELAEIATNRKKLQGRRLDFDCKKRKGQAGGATQEELQLAEEKFETSRAETEASMHGLLNNEVERISELTGFIEGMVEYHRQAATALDALYSELETKRNAAAAAAPKQYHRPVPQKNGTAASPAPAARTTVASPPVVTPPSPASTNLEVEANDPFERYWESENDVSTPAKPSARALFEFAAEQAGELDFLEGDIIELDNQLDDNWYQGRCKGKSGHFPVNYVEVLVPLPK